MEFGISGKLKYFMHWLIIRKLAIFLTIFLLTSCESMPSSWEWGAKPRPFTGVRNFPETDTDYGKGFKNGCENGLAVVTKGWVDTLNKQIDPVMLTKNLDYTTGWWDGFEQCVYISDWDVL